MHSSNSGRSCHRPSAILKIYLNPKLRLRSQLLIRKMHLGPKFDISPRKPVLGNQCDPSRVVVSIRGQTTHVDVYWELCSPLLNGRCCHSSLTDQNYNHEVPFLHLFSSDTLRWSLWMALSIISTCCRILRITRCLLQKPTKRSSGHLALNL